MLAAKAPLTCYLLSITTGAPILPNEVRLPRYNELAPLFKENGVDEIVCLSVNDTFVMNEWARDQEADNITLIPDGNGAFAEEMGLLVDKSAIGFGKRSWRYSMLVKDRYSRC